MNIIAFGAHPDDAEWYAGGTLVKWARGGHRVLSVSLTNGDIGHHEESPAALARRRAAEMQRCAARAGIESIVLEHHDGELLPSLEVRREIVRLIRENRADLVLTHRPWDYHPDHRYTAVAVQDAAFMVMVPHFCPETPALRYNPVFFYMMDHFAKPIPFQPDVAVDVTDAMDIKWAMLDAIESQMYEWLPWLEGKRDQVPAGAEQRLAWLQRELSPFFRAPAERSREVVRQWYGPAGDRAEFVELFEVCEYGRQPSKEELRALFPVPPPPAQSFTQ